MKKLFFSLVVSLLSAMGLMAQSSLPWTPATNEDYESEMVVYAGLADSNGPMNWLSNTYVAAFIDNECRGLAEFKSLDSHEVCYAALRIAGSADDNGKIVTFKVYYMNSVYSMPETTTYTAEGSLGTLSSLFTFNFNTPRYFHIKSDVEMTIGETVDLSSYVEWMEYDNSVGDFVVMQNPTVPDVLTWFFQDEEQEYITMNGNLATGVNETPAGQPLQAYLAVQCKAYDGNDCLNITVKKPEVLIASLTIIDQYKDGVTVNVNDYTTMTNILNNCYTINPANATEVPVWSCSDPEAIVSSAAVTYSGLIWTPVKPGTYTMTLSSQNCSVNLTVLVYQPVTSITCPVSTLAVRVGDNIAELLKKACVIAPADASNQTLNVTSTSTLMDTSGKATAEGALTVRVASASESSVYVDVPVIINQNYTITALKDELIFSMQANDAAINVTPFVRNNLVFAPNLPEANDMADRYVYSTTSSLLTIETSSSAAAASDTTIMMTGIGTATLKVTHTYKYHVWNATTSALELKQTENTCSFDITCYKGVEELEVSVSTVTIGNTQTYTITVDPYPADAYFVAEDVNCWVNKDATSGLAANWELATIEYDKDNDFVLTPKSIGKGEVVFNFEGVSATVNVNIGQTVHPEVGWKWISLYSGSMDLQTIQQHYTQYLEEIRSQSQLLANDPVYGYYGDLTEMTVGTAYKVKLSKNPADYVVPFTIAPAAQTVTLKKSWTWLGNPYQYDHALSEVLTSASLTQGDRIVSKSGGFAEYNGSQWTGTLTTLQNGLAYLYYNKAGQSKTLALPIETSLSQGTPAQHAAEREQSVWQYDESQWADNMTIIACVEGMDLTEGSYTVGAMVDGECRGEGQVVDGMLFITVHGQSGEQIAFCLYDADTERYTELQTRMQFGKMAGSLTDPVMMRAAETNGIHLQQLDATDRQVYDLYGRRVSGSTCTAGFYIVK